MGLLKPKTKQVVCQICGKTHTVAFLHKAPAYLDMTTQTPITNLLKAYTICECGALCFSNAHEILFYKENVTTQHWANLLNATYPSEEEKKLTLLTQGLQSIKAIMYTAHYYYQKGDQENRKKWLHIALTNIHDGIDVGDLQISGRKCPALNLKKNDPFVGVWFYTPHHKAADIYRQLGEFEKASQELSIIETGAKDDIVDTRFIEIERTLIRQNITNPR